MTPHKATEQQWGIVRRRAKNDFPDSTDSVLLELAHRVAAMESQHNLVVDSITDLQGCVNQLEAATQPPPPAGGLVDRIMETVMLDPGRAVRAIHAAPFTPIPVSERLPGAEDCDAKERCWWGDAGDDEFVPSWRLCEQPDKSCFDHWLPHWAIRLPQPLSSAPKTGSESSLLRAVYNLGRQHGAQARQEGEMVPVLWVRRKPGPGCNASVIAWLPGVGDLPIGEHILYAFPGTSQPRQEEEATPPPAPAGDPVAVPSGLVERVLSQLPSGTDPVFARQAILETADWADENGYIATARVLQEVAIRPITHPTPPPAPTGGLLEEWVADVLREEAGYRDTGPDGSWDTEAAATIRRVADWLDARGDRVSAAVLRRQADQ